MDPAKKQYLIFSAVIAIIISIIVNFTFIEFFKNTFAYGFPLNLTYAEGFGGFILRIINTVVIAALLTGPVYWAIMWFLNRARES